MLALRDVDSFYGRSHALQGVDLRQALRLEAFVHIPRHENRGRCAVGVHLVVAAVAACTRTVAGILTTSSSASPRPA